MNEKELTELSDAELLEEAKKLRSFSITHALLVGFLLGIVVFSFAKNTWGLVTLIPLYFVHKLVNDPKSKRYKALRQLIKERNLQ